MYLGTLAIFLYIVYLLISPYIIAIISAMLVAYIFFPLFKKTNKYITNKKIASFLVATFIILLVTIPTLSLINSLSQETYVLYSLGRQSLSSTPLMECETDSVLCKLIEPFTNLETRFYLEQILETVSSYIINAVSNFALSIPSILLNLFVIIFLIYYMFLEAPLILKKIKSLVPYKKKHSNLILKNLNDVTYSIVYGVFFLAIIEALLAIIGFTFAGIPSPILWGMLVGLLAFIPFIGATIIWVPMFLILLVQGSMNQVIIILFFGTIISTIDTFVRPVVLSGRSAINPAIMLIGILGGLKMFGLVGLILGPLILSFCIILVRIFMEERITV